MELSNNSFIVSTEQGNLVVNPKSIVEYKNITLIGDGYYDWGKTLAQDLAYIADQISSLKDGGVAQATFDATQFIGQFQTAQTEALNFHTENLLSLLDIKIQNKFAIIDQSIIDYQTIIDNALIENKQALEENIANTTIQLKNELNTVFEEKTLEINVLIDSINQSIELITKDVLEWQADINPKLTSIIERFQQFKTITETAVEEINKVIFDNYDDLNTRILNINTTVTNIIPEVLEASENFITLKLEEINENSITTVNLITDSLAIINPKLDSLETNVDLINTELETFVKTDNTILIDAKEYTDTKLLPIVGPNGSIPNLEQAVSQNLTTQRTINTDLDNRIKAFESETGIVTTTAEELNTFKQLTTSSFTATNKAISDLGIDAFNRLTVLEDYKVTTENILTDHTDNINTILTELETNTSIVNAVEITVNDLKDDTLIFSQDLSNSLEALTLKVDTVENSVVLEETIDDKIDTAVDEVKLYTDAQLLLVASQSATGTDAALTLANTYTDNKVAEILPLIPTEEVIDDITVKLTVLDNFKSKFESIDLPTVNDKIYDLNQKSNNLVNLVTETNTKIDQKNNYLYRLMDDRFRNLTHSVVTFDAIFPLLNKILGYIIENKITKDELDNLFTELTKLYMDELEEQMFNGAYIHVFVTGGKLQYRLIYNRERFFGLQNVLIMSPSGNKNYTDFISLSNSNTLQFLSGNKTFIINPASDPAITNANLVIDTPANIWDTVIRTTYLNEFGISTPMIFEFSHLLGIYPFMFRMVDLYFDNVDNLIGEFYLTTFDTLDTAFSSRIKDFQFISLKSDVGVVSPTSTNTETLTYSKNGELYSISSIKIVLPINTVFGLTTESTISSGETYTNLTATCNLVTNDDNNSEIEVSLTQNILIDVVYMLGVPT
jgi:hypothetical protein